MQMLLADWIGPLLQTEVTSICLSMSKLFPVTQKFTRWKTEFDSDIQRFLFLIPRFSAASATPFVQIEELNSRVEWSLRMPQCDNSAKNRCVNVNCLQTSGLVYASLAYQIEPICGPSSATDYPYIPICRLTSQGSQRIQEIYSFQLNVFEGIYFSRLKVLKERDADVYISPRSS